MSIRYETRKYLMHLVTVLSFLVFSGRVRLLPWKNLRQLAYLAILTFILLVPLKLFLAGTPLRSASRHQSTDYSSRILDITNFQWLMNNATTCIKERDTSKLMPILVHTARDHFMERNSIRETFGSLKSYEDWTIRVVFLLGDSEDDGLSGQITDEFQDHGDMVMGNFIDSYKNLTYKHLMGYKWILDYCSEATYVWKVDDDIFIDPLTIVKWRSSEMEHINRSSGAVTDVPRMFDFYCPVLTKSKPQRDPSLKWFVPEEIWPLKEFPNYCSGWAYGISVPWIRSILSVSESAKNHLWIDDIYVTGILVKLVNKLQKESPYVKNIWSYSTHRYDPTTTTFCLDNNLPLNDLRTRRFGVFGRLPRGSMLMRENKCIWENIISGKWDTLAH